MPGGGSSLVTYEYLLVDVTGLSLTDRQARFYTLGLEGWQLVNVVSEKTGFFSSRTIAHFNRKLG